MSTESLQFAGGLRRLVAGIGISSFGDGLVFVAFPLLAVRLTHEPLLIAGLMVAGRLPWLLVALPAGALVDRVSRRKLVMSVDLARAVVIALVALAAVLGRIRLGELYLASFLVCAGETVVSAATRSALPLLASAEDLPAANGRFTAAETVGVQFAGPAVGGVVFAVASSLPFVGDAVSYLASALLLGSAMPDDSAREPPAHGGVLADVRSGLRWFLASNALRLLALLVASFAFCQALVLSVLVIYATRVLHLHGADYGFLLAVAALGDIAASLCAGRIQTRLGGIPTVLGSGILAGGAYVLLGSTTLAYVAVVALALEAAGSSLGNVTTLSMRHRLIPLERFGLVNNAFRMCVLGVVPLGALVGGALTAVLGTRPTFVLAGIAQLVATAMVAVPLRLATAR